MSVSEHSGLKRYSTTTTFGETRLFSIVFLFNSKIPHVPRDYGFLSQRYAADEPSGNTVEATDAPSWPFCPSRTSGANGANQSSMDPANSLVNQHISTSTYPPMGTTALPGHPLAGLHPFPPVQIPPAYHQPYQPLFPSPQYLLPDFFSHRQAQINLPPCPTRPSEAISVSHELFNDHNHIEQTAQRNLTGQYSSHSPTIQRPPNETTINHATQLPHAATSVFPMMDSRHHSAPQSQAVSAPPC